MPAASSRSARPLELYDRPANVFVATFIGSPSMNLIDATVIESDGNLAARTQSGVLLPMPSTTKLSLGQAIQYGYRPEHISLSDAAVGIPAMSRSSSPWARRRRCISRSAIRLQLASFASASLQLLAQSSTLLQMRTRFMCSIETLVSL